MTIINIGDILSNLQLKCQEYIRDLVVLRAIVTHCHDSKQENVFGAIYIGTYEQTYLLHCHYRESS